jgi:hypothetical protein
MQNKIKVLFLASDPFHAGVRLRLDEEVRAVEQAIRRGRARGSVVLVPHLATRTRDLREALLNHKPQIVHFAGHGAPSGGIFLGNENGQRQAVGTEALRRLFGMVSETVKVVVLNGCDTLSTIEALSEVVDYTVGMNDAISDDSAIVFSEAFYSALAMGETVLGAFDWAVCELHLESNAEVGIPQRRIRHGVDLDRPLVAPGAVSKSTLPDPPSHATQAEPATNGASGPGQRNKIGTLKARRDVLFEEQGGGAAGAGGQDNDIGQLSSRDVKFIEKG